MGNVYIIKSSHGYSYLMELGLLNKAFKSKERCEEIIYSMAESKYGKPFYSEKSEYVKMVKNYWAGDYSMEELEEKIGSKNKAENAFNSALYYDFCYMFHIEEYEIAE